MSIYKYFTKFINESNAFHVNTPTVKTEVNEQPIDEKQEEAVEEQEQLDEQHGVGTAGDAYAGNKETIKDLADLANAVNKIHNELQSRLKSMNAEQNAGSKSITKDIEDASNVSTLGDLKKKESAVDSKRQSDINDLTNTQYKGVKSITKDLETSKSKNMGESISFIKKYSIDEKKVQAGTSLEPDVEPSISPEIKSAEKEPEGMIKKTIEDRKQLKNAQVKGKSITQDVESTKSLDIPNPEPLVNQRVKETDAFNKSQNTGKSITKDLDDSDSFAAIMKSAIDAQKLHDKTVSNVNAFNKSQNESLEQKEISEGDVVTILAKDAQEVGKENIEKAKEKAKKNGINVPDHVDDLTDKEKSIKDKAEKTPINKEKVNKLLKDSKISESMEIPSDEVLKTIKDLLEQKTVELSEQVKRDLILNGYINSSRQLTEKAKMLMKKKEVKEKCKKMDK